MFNLVDLNKKTVPIKVHSQSQGTSWYVGGKFKSEAFFVIILNLSYLIFF